MSRPFALSERMCPPWQAAPPPQVAHRENAGRSVRGRRRAERGATRDMGLILSIGFPPIYGGILRGRPAGVAESAGETEEVRALGVRFRATEQMEKLARAGKGFYSG